MSSLLAITNDGAAEVGAFFYALAVVGTVAAVTTSFASISLHLKHYRRPDLQRLVIRIMFMVPLYAVTSLASLTSRYLAEYVDLFRDVYEAFVVYTFFILMINYLGGERELLTMLQDRMTTHHLWPLHYFLSPIDLSDPKVFLIVRRGVLQFVVLKPILAVFILIMKLMGFYHEGLIRFDSAYVYVSLFYNVSVCVAMYCLVIFYLQCSKDLEAYRPLPKFICVKAIIFFSFWQGFIVAVLVGFDIIHDKGDYPAQAIAVAIQDGLICIESVIFAIGHAYAYPWTDYGTSHRLASRVVVIYALKDVLGTRDIIQDIIQTFSGVTFKDVRFTEVEQYERSFENRRQNSFVINSERRLHTRDHNYGTLIESSSAADQDLALAQGRSDSLSLSPANTPAATSIRRAPSPNQIRSGLQAAGFAEGPGDDLRTIEFDEPEQDPELEALFGASRELIYGDYNFPVAREDERFMDPPQVQVELERQRLLWESRTSS